MGLTAGLYSVIVSDTNGCTTSCAIEVASSSGPMCTATSTASDCDTANGSAMVVTTGGTSPYSYEWSNGATTETAFGLASGSYIVTVTDAVGCTTLFNANVPSNGDAPICGIRISDASCGESTGSVQAEVSGGTPPYQYIWLSLIHI